MAATATTVFTGNLFGAKQRISVSNITMDASYPTGGEAITANQLGLSRITSVIPAASTTGYVPAWDQANSKLEVFYGDYSATVDGVLSEVAATTDLSAVTFTVIAFGV